MELHVRRTLAALAAFLLTLGPLAAVATSVVPLDIDQIVAGAQHVAHVRCTGNRVEPDSVVGVVTVTTFDVLDRAKGASGPVLIVRQPGGERNGLHVNFHVPQFAVGEEYVLFMPAPSKAGLASPVGLSQGVFDVVPVRGGKEVGNGRDFAELIPTVDPAKLPSGVAKRLQLAPQERKRMDLGDFMALVRAKAGAR